mgnify:CR=1 FL=1
MDEKDTSPATGGLTCCLRAQFAGTFDGQVGSANGLCVGGLWAEISGAPCEDVNFLIERYQKINNQPNKNGSKNKPSALPSQNRRPAWIWVVFGGEMDVR